MTNENAAIVLQRQRFAYFCANLPDANYGNHTADSLKSKSDKYLRAVEIFKTPALKVGMGGILVVAVIAIFINVSHCHSCEKYDYSYPEKSC